MLEKLLYAIPLIFLLEGAALLFLPDALWKKLRADLAQFKTGQLRAVGIAMMSLGAALLLLLSAAD